MCTASTSNYFILLIVFEVMYNIEFGGSGTIYKIVKIGERERDKCVQLVPQFGVTSSKHVKADQSVHFLEVGEVHLFRPGTPYITLTWTCRRRRGKWRKRRRARVFKSASTFEI